MINLFAWTLSLVIMAVVIFANYPLQQFDEVHTAFEFGLYDALSRVSWSIAICYIIFACVHNYGGFFNWFLAHRFWQPLSRLSYSIYLMHFAAIMMVMGTMKTTNYFDVSNTVSFFFIFFPFHIIFALLLKICFYYCS